MDWSGLTCPLILCIQVPAHVVFVELMGLVQCQWQLESVVPGKKKLYMNKLCKGLTCMKDTQHVEKFHAPTCGYKGHKIERWKLPVHFTFLVTSPASSDQHK